MLCEIVNAEKDKDLAEFLLCNYQFVEHSHRRSKFNQHIFKPMYYQTSAKLNDIYEGKHENTALTAHINAAVTQLELED